MWTDNAYSEYWLQKAFLFTCTGHHKLSGQTEDAVVHVELNDDGACSFKGRHHDLQHRKRSFNKEQNSGPAWNAVRSIYNITATFIIYPTIFSTIFLV